MPKQYSKIILVVGPGFDSSDFDHVAKEWFSSKPCLSKCADLNTYLTKGWEFLQAIPHLDSNTNVTVIAFLMGKPKSIKGEANEK